MKTSHAEIFPLWIYFGLSARLLFFHFPFPSLFFFPWMERLELKTQSSKGIFFLTGDRLKRLFLTFSCGFSLSLSLSVLFAVSRSPSDFISPWTPYEQHPVPIKYLGAYPFLCLPCLTACLLVWFTFPALKALPYWSRSISYLVPNGSSSFTLSLCMPTCISVWKCQVIKMNPLVEKSTKEPLYI